MNKLNTKISKKNGAVAVLVALMIVPLIMFTAFAVDLGFLYLTKNEVQNSADAAALAGATVFFRNGVNPDNFDVKGGPAGTTSTCTGATITETAACTAAAAIGLNEDSTNTFDITVNIWDNMSPAGPLHVPAVKVNLTRTFVPFFFARVFGFLNTDISASATAIAKSQSSPLPAPLLPVALNDCVFLDGGVWNDRVGVTLMYDTAYPSALCNSMQWTSLGYDIKMGASDIWNIINSGSSATVAPAPNAPYATGSDCHPPGTDGIDTCIYLDPGVKESVFGYLADLTGKVFSVPVVADVPKKSGNQPVQKISCIRLENVCNSPGQGGYSGTYTGGRTDPPSTETPGGQPSSCPGSHTYFSITILDDSECLAGGTGGGMSYGTPSPPQLAD